MSRGGSAAVLALALCLALPTAAKSATRHASPTGDDSDTSCPATSPCDIDTAVEHTSVADGDVVIVASGTYSPPTAVSIHNAITVRGGPGSAPTITGSFGTGGVVRGLSGGHAVLRRLRVTNNSPTGTAIELFAGGRLDRVEAVGGRYGCEMNEDSTVIVNSICVGIERAGAFLDPINPTGVTHQLVNATAIGGEHGVSALSEPGALNEVSLKNTIARATGTDSDVAATAEAGSSALITISNSSYETTSVDGDGTAEINELGGQQIAAPVFVNPAAQNYRQAAGSPTINSGDNSKAEGSVDIDGEDRIQDGIVDIGADERNVPPNVEITSGPAEGSRTNDPTPTFGLVANEPGSSFWCRVDGAGFFTPCTGSASHTTAPLGDGPHTFEAFARDPETNVVGPVTGRSFTVDTVAPETFITKGPRPRVRTRRHKAKVRFRFKADEAAATFECKLDRRRWRSCQSPKRYRIKAKRRWKRHVFKVRATDQATNRDATPAKYVFKVKRRR